ncbi:flagellar brake protein [Alkalithermobacter paradoxus]|uniref:Flagellar brake protein YcgR n=1 Tax=Alkalithermobacter paradoxus TaxID=29349 RepID=A0A1V4IAT2_9FIRM|nr:flagellar brake protein YcgR [[Clostridium] thermoalcaliphilum]
MKCKKKLEIGQKLQIEIETSDIKENNLISQLLEIVSEDEYFIAVPIVNTSLFPIYVGSKITIYYTIESSGVFKFSAEVIDRKKGDISYLHIKRISEIKKIQRRDYFRLEISIPIELYDLGDNLISKGYTKDISGGGISAILDRKIQNNIYVYCKIDIDNKKYKLHSKIVRSGIYEKNTDLFEIGISFEKIDNKERNNIVGFIFKEQRKLMQKGLI